MTAQDMSNIGIRSDFALYIFPLSGQGSAKKAALWSD